MSTNDLVLCPQCEGDDIACMLCGGAATVTQNQASEWRRQNDAPLAIPDLSHTPGPALTYTGFTE